MITFESGGARITLLDDLVQARYSPDSEMSQSFRAEYLGHNDVLRKVIELRMMHGGAARHALIGGLLETAPAASLAAHVGVGPLHPHMKAFDTDIRPSLLAALPVDYAAAALAGIGDYQTIGVMPSGRLTIDRAAYNQVESSPNAFRFATTLLLVAFTATVLGDDIEKALRACLTPR